MHWIYAGRMVKSDFVPVDFSVPASFDGPGFRLEPLGPQHNERDHVAWMSSIDHIKSTPGFKAGEIQSDGWPEPMELHENLADLISHDKDFRERTGFTYSILDDDDVIGCVYIYPTSQPGHDADVRSWVSADRADLDEVVWGSLSAWIQEVWPFQNAHYRPRI